MECPLSADRLPIYRDPTQNRGALGAIAGKLGGTNADGGPQDSVAHNLALALGGAGRDFRAGVNVMVELGRAFALVLLSLGLWLERLPRGMVVYKRAFSMSTLQIWHAVDRAVALDPSTDDRSRPFFERLKRTLRGFKLHNDTSELARRVSPLDVGTMIVTCLVTFLSYAAYVRTVADSSTADAIARAMESYEAARRDYEAAREAFDAKEDELIPNPFVDPKLVAAVEEANERAAQTRELRHYFEPGGLSSRARRAAVERCDAARTPGVPRAWIEHLEALVHAAKAYEREMNPDKTFCDCNSDAMKKPVWAFDEPWAKASHCGECKQRGMIVIKSTHVCACGSGLQRRFDDGKHCRECPAFVTAQREKAEPSAMAANDPRVVPTRDLREQATSKVNAYFATLVRRHAAGDPTASKPAPKPTPAPVDARERAGAGAVEAGAPSIVVGAHVRVCTVVHPHSGKTGVVESISAAGSVRLRQQGGGELRIRCRGNLELAHDGDGDAPVAPAPPPPPPRAGAPSIVVGAHVRVCTVVHPHFGKTGVVESISAAGSVRLRQQGGGELRINCRGNLELEPPRAP